MKQTLISILILFSLFTLFTYSPTYAQEDTIIVDETESTQEDSTDEIADDSNEEVTTLEDTLPQEEVRILSTDITFFQGVLAILAPTTFILIGYLLIKKLKL